MWGGLPADFSVTGFCGRGNAYGVSSLPYPVVRLACSADLRLVDFAEKLFRGRIFQMYGLERRLAGFDIAHVAEPYYAYALQAVRAKRLNPRLKVVVTAWDTSMGRFDIPSIGNFFLGKRSKRIIAEVVRDADLFLPVSGAAAAVLRSYGVPDGKMRVFPPAVVSGASVSDGSALRSRLGIAAGAYYLAVNRLVVEKGVYGILSAWKIFMSTPAGKGKKLLMVGAGPEEAGLMSRAAEYGIADSVVFAGVLPHDEVRSLYAGACALVLASIWTPSWQEQFGYVLAEAIIAGCPVVGTRSGSIPEVAGDAGIIVPPEDPDALSDAFARVIDPETRAVLLRNGEARKPAFSAERFVQGLIGSYRLVIS